MRQLEERVWLLYARLAYIPSLESGEGGTEMHARVTTVSVQPDKVAETKRIYNESILPAVKAASGNRGVFLLIDPDSGKGISITLWDSQADGEAYDSSGSYREQVGKVAPFFSGPPSLATYDVAAQG